MHARQAARTGPGRTARSLRPAGAISLRASRARFATGTSDAGVTAMADDAPQPSVPTEKIWQHPEGGPGPATSSKRRKKIVHLLAVMTTLAGIIVGWLLLVRHFSPPFFLSIT